MIERIKVNQHEDKIVIYVRDKAIELPWHIGLELAGVIKFQSQKAEEYALANKIAFDTAVCWKSGIPVGFSDNPKILEMAKQEASWNPELRKYMGNGVKVDAQFGKPKLIVK